MSLTGTEAGVATQAPPRADGGSASLTDKRWWVLCVLGLAQLMVVLDGTVVNIALPSAQQALDFSNDQRQWIVTGYASSTS
ncbi:hypothetical protein [Frankia sp. R43]|uniref:hypothetical protein n=1 Tax=Frankia sp. R43 TaxID=269536 RepID=UPI000A50126B|nr:hypothetical protein [Frankia sp. R43]